MPVALRHFQQVLEQQTYWAWNSGYRNIMGVSATGSGKTVLLSKLMYDEPGCSVAIAHRQELVSQISTAIARNGVRHRVMGNANGGTLNRVISALHTAEFGYSLLDPNGRAAVGGVDTVLRMDPSDTFFRQCVLKIQDEAHHVLKKNKWGKVDAMFPHARGFYPTATPLRADGFGLGRHADGVIDYMLLAPSMREIIDMGYLTDYRIFAPESDVNMAQVQVGESGEYNREQLSNAVRNSHIVGDVVKSYLRFAAGKLGVTFAVDVEEAAKIAAEFRRNGVSAEVVSAKTPDSLRANIIGRFKRREIMQLVNVDLFGEGFDLPAIEVVSFARPTNSFSLYCQQFGRALRLMIDPTKLSNWENYTPAERKYFISISRKPVAIIIDHVGNVVHHRLPDARREWSLDRREKRASGPSDAIPMRNCVNPFCTQPYERVHKFCPYCGSHPPIVERSDPVYVDGDLFELDLATLQAMRGEITRIDGDFPGVWGQGPVANAAARGHWQNRQEAQRNLRNSIAWWAGVQAHLGRSESESYRRFYFSFGVDVGNAQTLGKQEAIDLQARIDKELVKVGVNPTIDAGSFFAHKEYA